jgi:uncharacterized membrane protein
MYAVGIFTVVLCLLVGLYFILLKRKDNIVMGAIIMCLIIIALGVSLYIFDHTKAGKRFFDEKD